MTRVSVDDPIVRGFLDGRPDLRPNTRDAYEKDLARLVVFARRRSKSLAALTLHDLRQFVAEESDRYAARTVLRTVTALRQCYRVALEKGLVATNPAELCMPPAALPRRPKTLSSDEWKALEAWLGVEGEPRELAARVALGLCVETGARGAEVVALQVSDFGDAFTNVALGDGRLRRTVPLSEPLARRLARLAADAGPRRRLFVDGRGRPLGAQGVRRLFERARRSAGLDRRPSPTLVRNTVAARWLAKGQDVAFVRKLLGLVRLPSVEPYVFETSEQKLQELVRSLHPRA